MRRNVHFDIAAIMFAYWTWFVPRVMVKDVEAVVCVVWGRIVRLFDKNIFFLLQLSAGHAASHQGQPKEVEIRRDAEGVAAEDALLPPHED